MEPSAPPAPRLARELRAGTLQRQEVNRAPGGGEAKERPGGDGRAAVGAGARARPAVGPAGTAVVLAAPRGGCRRLPWFFRHSGLKCLPVLLEAGSSPLNPSFFFLSAGDRRLRGGGGRGLGGGGVSEKGTGPAGWGGGDQNQPEGHEANLRDQWESEKRSFRPRIPTIPLLSTTECVCGAHTPGRGPISVYCTVH